MTGITLATLLTIVGTLSATTPNVGFYPMTTQVIEVNDIAITVQDFNDNVWTFLDDLEDWFVGDTASLLMCDNGTEIIYDDIIIDAVYDGWIGEDGMIEIK